MQRAYALSETACALANSPHDGAPPDRAGIAYSLRTQGYINQRLGDYPKGMRQLLQARGMFESLRIDDGLADVFDGIAGIYYQIGDFAEMLNYSYRQLEVAQRIGDRRRVANAHNNLANVYSESGDYDRTIATLHHNLQAAGELGYGRIVALSYLNLAETFLLAGDGERALENALAGLQVSRKAGLTLFQVYAFNLIGNSYIKLGSPQQATDYLEQALALSERLESKVTQSLVLLSLGEVYRAMQQPGRALAYAQQAVAVAQALDARSDLFKGHLLVAEIYEQQGDLAQALHHFKKYHAYREMVFNQEADQRLKVLEVVHDTETARREAAIAHLRTVDLQQEIDQHTRVRLQLQRQLDYVQALARCSQTLLWVAECEARQQEVLNEALEHLRVGSQASRAYVFRNFQDPDLGSCLGIFAEACAPDIHPHLGVPGNRKFPWSRLPAALFDTLQAGMPAGGPVEILFAGTPSLLETLRHQVNPLLSVQFFPIFINDQWWGFVGFDDCVNARHLGEQEIMLLGTAAEMIASTLQRWQAELGLRSLNDRLERQVSARTAELSDTVMLLKQEIAERERAEAEIQQMVGTLEQRVADRTEELTAFLDLVLLAGQAVSLDDIVDQALSRIIEVTRSRALCVHLVDADGATLRLAAQQGLSAREAARVQSVRPRPAFRRWLQQPNDPLVSTDLSEIVLLPSALRLPGFHTYLGAQIRIGQQIAGLLSYFRPGGEGFGVDEVALGTALAEQMGLVLETDRLRANAEAMAVHGRAAAVGPRPARLGHAVVVQPLPPQPRRTRGGRGWRCEPPAAHPD